MAHSQHAHLEHDSPSLADAARGALTTAGEQWTEMRAQVFAALAGFGRPVSAYDVAAQVSAAHGRRVAANSIYRILDLFVACNLALRVESRNAYIANNHPGCVHDCIFLLCVNCGATDHIDDDATAQAVRKAASKDGFRVRRPVIEVLGRCRDCAEA